MSKSLAFKIPFVIMLGFIMFGLAAPFIVSAQTTPDTDGTPLPSIWDPKQLGDTLLVCTGSWDPTGRLNYCDTLCDLVYQVIWIVYLAIVWVIWVIAPLSFVAGGIMYMLAGAKPDLESQAKKVLLGAVIGVAIVLCSFILINTVVTFFNIKGVGGFGSSVCAST